MTNGEVVPADGVAITPAEGAARRTVLVSERTDAVSELRSARKAFHKHMRWILVGVSPGAFIPLIYASSELGGYAVVGVVAVTILGESWRALRTRLKIKRLEVVVRDFTDQIDDLNVTEITAEDPSEA